MQLRLLVPCAGDTCFLITAVVACGRLPLTPQHPRWCCTLTVSTPPRPLCAPATPSSCSHFLAPSGGWMASSWHFGARREHSPRGPCRTNQFPKIASCKNLSDTSIKDATYGSPTTDDFTSPGIRCTARSRSIRDEGDMYAFSIVQVNKSAAL